MVTRSYNERPVPLASRILEVLRTFVVAASCFTTCTLLLAVHGKEARGEPVYERNAIRVDGDELGTITFGQLFIDEDILGEYAMLKEKYLEIFNEELRANGYTVKSNVGSTFKKGELPDTDFVLAGTLKEFDCTKQNKVTCGMRISWELLRTRDEKVVYQLTSTHEEMRLKKMESDAASKALLLGALRSILSRDTFVRAMKGEGRSEAPPATFDVQTIQRCSVGPRSLSDSMEDSMAASVVIKSREGVGSGVVISPDGYVLTAAHVVAGGIDYVRRKDGSNLEAEVLRVDKNSDSALVRVKGINGLPCVDLSSDSPRSGANVFAIGTPAGEDLAFSVSKGVVSGNRTFAGSTYIQTDASVNPGNSGGPLLDEEGRLIGVVSWKVAKEQFEGLGFAVPTATLLRTLGIEMGDVSGTFVAQPTVQGTDNTSMDAMADPDWYYVGPDAPGRRPGWVKTTRTLGIIVAIAGAGSVAFSTTRNAVRVEDQRLPLLVGGIAGVTLGGGAFIGSYLFDPTRSHKDEVARSPQWTVGMGPGTVLLGGIF